MALNALLKFTQGATVGPDGEALEVSGGSQVTVGAANTTDMSFWSIELLYAPPGSGMEVPLGTPSLVASGTDLDSVEYQFTPPVNVPGCYRFRLKFTAANGVTNTDIRNVGVAHSNGLIPPPVQDLPLSLPLEGPGAKPNELNFGGNAYGWVGGNGDKLLHDAIKMIGSASGAVPTSRIVGSGAGLTGGGDLSADRTLAIGANADGSIVVNANDIQVGTLASDGQHGNRGGGSLHSTATTSSAGFLSASDKTKLDGLNGDPPFEIVLYAETTIDVSGGVPTTWEDLIQFFPDDDTHSSIRWTVTVSSLNTSKKGGRAEVVTNHVRNDSNPGAGLNVPDTTVLHVVDSCTPSNDFQIIGGGSVVTLQVRGTAGTGSGDQEVHFTAKAVIQQISNATP